LFNKVERLISSRNLKPKKKEGFLKVISIFSFLGIMLGVAILIIVMSVMNGFRNDLTNKILGFNPHIVIKPYSSNIDESFKLKLKQKYKNFEITESFGSEAVIMNNELVKGIFVKGIEDKNINNFEFIEKNLIDGDLTNFKEGRIILGKELAIDLGVVVGDKINLMSSAFITTPLGGIPRQDNFKVAAVFSSGFFEFDQNVAFLNLKDSLLFFNKTKDDLDLQIKLKDPLKADFYKKEIEKINENYYVYSWADLNKSFFGALKLERNIMFIILTLIIIVAAFNIISGLTILIKNKTKEIAIFKTLGLSNKSIMKSFFLTGFTIGFLATITGIILGVIFSFYIEEIRFFISSTFDLEIFPQDIYFLDKLPSEINPISIMIIFLFSILVTALASFFPAKAVSKMETIKALKYE
tara:strand:+ start:887 stop:2119 length:1233 start_codon:yes stop_codon:yes gene_type:complete